MTVALAGLDGHNPSGFLAALGAVRLATEGAGSPARLSWVAAGPEWRPNIDLATGTTDRDAVLEAIVTAHAGRDVEREFGWARDVMTLTRDDVRDELERSLGDGDSARAASVGSAAAELPLRRKSEYVEYTPFRLIPRVGRARFVSTARDLSRPGNARAIIAAALFGPRTYSKANNLRWDPAATVPARAYAGEAPTNFGPLAVPGVMLLAVAGLRSFPLLLDRGHATCRGFGPSRKRFVWPIWKEPLEPAALGMLLSLPELHAEPADPDRLLRHGVCARLVARRERLGSDSEALAWGEPIQLPQEIPRP